MHNFKTSKIKEFIFRNFPLKILSVVLAIVVWIIIVNVDDPVKSQTISGITVTLQNEDALIEKGYTYQVESGSVISIVVKAPQTVVDKLKNSDFTAYADLSARTDKDACKIYVSCNNNDVARQVDIVSLRTEYVQLSIDNKISKTFPVAVEYVGEPESGYIVSEAKASPTSITVTGAETVINQIEMAKVSYDIANMNQSVSESMHPLFYDSEGKEVNTQILEFSRDTINVNITILPTKWVPIHYALSGNLPEGYEISNQEANVDSICVAGTQSDLNELESIDIPSGALSIDDISEDTELTIPLSNYLPEKYTIVSQTKELKVKISLNQMVSKIMEIPLESITIRGIEKGYEAVIDSAGVEDHEKDETEILSITVVGEKSIMETLTAEDIVATIPASGKGTGQFRIKISFTSEKEISIPEAYFAMVTINKIAEETEEASETETETGSESASAETEMSETETEPEPYETSSEEATEMSTNSDIDETESEIEIRL